MRINYNVDILIIIGDDRSLVREQELVPNWISLVDHIQNNLTKMRLKLISVGICCVELCGGADTEEEFEIDIDYEK